MKILLINHYAGSIWQGKRCDSGCDVVDLDGPVFLKQDRSPSVRYEDGHITCGDEVWGPGTVP